MPILIDRSGKLFRPTPFPSGKDLESIIGEIASQMFGPLGIYLNEKRRIGDEIVSIPQDHRASRPSHDQLARQERRMQADTVVVPAQEDGFKRVFLGQNCWHEIRISAAMRDRIKFIAGYQVAPISAITHIAEVKEIKPYKDTGKFILHFAGPAQEIGPIGLKDSNRKPQGPIYVRKDLLIKARFLDDALDGTT